MEKLRCVVRYLRGLESLWSGRGGGRLSLLGVKLKEDRICISEENAYRIFGIRNFAEFWKVNSPITAYREYKDNGEVFVEFEGEKGKVMSYLFVGAFAYHLMRGRVVTDELEKIEVELSDEAAERKRQNVPQEELVNEIAEEVEIHETQEEEEEEPPRKRRKLPWGICRRSEYDPERMEPYPRCGERLKRQLHEKGLMAFLLKDREEEPDSDADAYMTPTGSSNTYENVRQVPDYENTFNITTEY
jgi:hypothetical protein